MKVWNSPSPSLPPLPPPSLSSPPPPLLPLLTPSLSPLPPSLLHIPLLACMFSSSGRGVMGLGSGGTGLDTAPWLLVTDFRSEDRWSSPILGFLGSWYNCSFLLPPSPSSSLSLNSSSRAIRLSRCCSVCVYVCGGGGGGGEGSSINAKAEILPCN